MTPERIKELRGIVNEDKGVVPNAPIISELLAEVERQAKIIKSLNAIIDGHEETVKELEADHDEWKRVAENNTQGMIGVQGIIDGAKSKCTICGKDRATCDGSFIEKP